MRHILHADFDAFYAAVEQRDNPALRGKPVVVGGSPEGRGVVASASYEVRRFGVRSAMPMRTALQRCPGAVRVPPRFDRYADVSRQVMAIFRGITPLVEPLSLDEAYLDVTQSVTAASPPARIASALKRRVRADLDLTISVGVATTKSAAKIASDMNKPDGLTVVPPGSERDFLAPLPVDRLWGIGPKTAERMSALGVTTIGELAAMPADWFASHFGRHGLGLRRLSLGEDDRPVVVERERKSVSAETTLPRDSGDPDLLIELVNRLSQRVGAHLERNGAQGRTVKIKLRLADFTTFTRQTTVPYPVRSASEVATVAGDLVRVEVRPGRLFRLVGVGVSGFDQPAERPSQPRLTGFE